jgi:hypothetical protein
MEGVEEQEAGRVILDLCTAIEVLTDVGDESPDSEAKRAWRNGCRWMAGAPLEEAPKARPRAPEAASAEGSQPGAVKESLTTGSQEEPPAGPRTHSQGVLECIGYAMGIIEMTAATLKAPASEGGMPDSPLLPQLHHAYNSLKAARDFPDLAPAAPQEGDTNQGDADAAH